MFYCDPCADKREWPPSLSRSYGRCEICDEMSVCNDKPSRHLPPPKQGFIDPRLVMKPAKPAVPKGPQKINYDRLNDFIRLFTKAERDSWADGGKAPDWVLEAMLWFMAQDPGHQELMRRLADS
jgi:hypothetical protein